MEANIDENELQQIERELQEEILPGTEVMTDVGTHHFIKNAVNGRVLVPQPTSDPHDPLNWSPKWKALAITAASTSTFALALQPLSLAPMFPYLIEAFDSSLTDVVKFTGVAILVLGFSNFIWVPMSTTYGRRPVYIFSLLICLASGIWRARATTYNSFMGACVLNGIGAGPAETIQAAVNADIFFLYDRGFWNTLYWVFVMGTLMVGPIFSGSMALHVGWRSFWWLCVAVNVVALLMATFMFPETKWHRLHPDEVMKNAIADGDISDPTLHHEKQPNTSTRSTSSTDSTNAENGLSALSHQATARRDPYLGRGGPSKQQWKLWQPNEHALRTIIQDIWIPWKLFAFPIAEFSAFVVSWSCSAFLAINLTQSQNFAYPPYNFSSQSIGFMNFAVLTGALIGLATNGYLSDWISDRATRKNRGIREPEMRLPALIPYVFIMVLGEFIIAFGQQYKWPWESIVIVGYTCTGIQVAAIPAIATTYAVDSYKPVAGSLMAAITVNKNVWGYGFAEFITPWILKQGYVPPIMTNMSLIVFFCSTAVVFYFYGKTLRRWSRNSSVHRL